MITFFIIAAIVTLIAIALLVKIKGMPKYKIIEEKSHDGLMKHFPKIRKGFSYKYLEQTKDFPGYEKDTFLTSSLQTAGQETEDLAELIVKNHMMTTVSGIE